MKFSLFSQNYISWEDYQRIISAREHFNFVTEPINESMDNLWGRVK